MSESIIEGAGQTARPSGVAQEEPAASNWTAIERADDFRHLVHQKRNFIIPATIFFLVYYFGFLVLVGYFPSIVETNIIGNINIAYLFALSQFIVAWIIVYLYVRQANGFDKLVSAIVNRVKGGKK
jgi:uncharacterized membrane protein (DUF485 family)